MSPAHATALPAASGAALADVATRFAVHFDFDRLVLSLPPGTHATSHQSGDTLIVELPGCGHVIQPPRWGARLLALQDTPGLARLRIAPGARVRVWPMGDRLVIDALNAAPAQKPAHARGERPTPPPGLVSHPVPEMARPRPLAALGHPEAKATTMAGPLIATAPFAAPSASQARLSTADSKPGLPVSSPTVTAGLSNSLPPAPPEASSRTKLPEAPGSDTAASPAAGSAVLPLARGGDIDGPAVLVPCARGTGAAAFQRGGESHIVFDQGKPLDLSALKDDPVFGGVQEQVLPDGMELRLPSPGAGHVRMLPRADGWAVIVTPFAHNPALPEMQAHVNDGILAIEASGPGQIVVLADELTGARLLVGTQTAGGQRMPAAHSAPEFTILPSWFGLVVAPISDRLIVRKSAAGFDLSAHTPPELALSWSKEGALSWPDGRVMTRLFDLPDLPPDDLHRRLGQALRDAALSPKPARFAPRLAVARDMLTQGLDVEAAAVLHTAAADDPAHQGDPAVAGLSAIADWLSAKRSGAEAPPSSFDPAQLGSSDEAALWRALLRPNMPDPATQAAVLAPVWPLIFSYPQALRRPMLLAAAALLQTGGQTGAWTALLAASPDQGLDASRAALMQQQGKIDEALALLDRVAGRSDRLARADAMLQALELRVATHKLDAAPAADVLDRQLYAWRGGDRELKLRMRVAELRAQAGNWRAALSTLRTAEQLFPDARVALHAAEEKTVADLLGGERAGRLGSFDLVTLAEEAATLFSSAEVERRIGPVLVEKLLALDLPERAEPILRKLFDRAPDLVSKAHYGLGLASLIADRGDAHNALDVLDATDDDGLASGLVERRMLLRAKLLGMSGEDDRALALLAGHTGVEASDAQADLLEKRSDWRGASAVLASALQQPDFTKLSESVQRVLILRLARDESSGNDAAGLRALRQAQHARFASGDGAELFAILTADPITSTTDLARSGRELSTLRTLPAKLAQARPF